MIEIRKNRLCYAGGSFEIVDKKGKSVLRM